jgi:hypothetical protein
VTARTSSPAGNPPRLGSHATIRSTSGPGTSWQDQDLVFPDQIGRFLVSRCVDRVFKSLLGQAGLPTTFTPHSLRHSTGTYFTARGVPDRVVMEMLGHSSLEMTRRYQHVMSSILNEAAEQLASKSARLIVGSNAVGSAHYGKRPESLIKDANRAERRYARVDGLAKPSRTCACRAGHNPGTTANGQNRVVRDARA